MNKFISLLVIALFAFAVLPAGAAPEQKQIRFSNPMVAAVDTAKAGPAAKKETKKVKKAKKAKKDKGELGAGKKKPA